VNKLKFYLAQIINDAVGQSWTVFGLLVGWIVLPEGETRNFIGVTLAVLTLIWAVTMPLRLESHDEE
jgi:hypothetical protein